MSELTIDQAAYEAAYAKLVADVINAVNGNLPAFAAAWSNGEFPAEQMIHVTASAFSQVFTSTVEIHLPAGATFQTMADISANRLSYALQQIIIGKMKARGISDFCPSSRGATLH